HDDLLAALQRVGVEPFSPDGEQFDPQVHEAVAQQPIEGAESGVVAEVFQQGYRLGERVRRPARVLVAGSDTITRWQNGPAITRSSGSARTRRRRRSRRRTASWRASTAPTAIRGTSRPR